MPELSESSQMGQTGMQQVSGDQVHTTVDLHQRFTMVEALGNYAGMPRQVVTPDAISPNSLPSACETGK